MKSTSIHVWMYDNITLVEFDLCLKWVLPKENLELKKSVEKITYACCVLSKYVILIVIFGRWCKIHEQSILTSSINNITRFLILHRRKEEMFRWSLLQPDSTKPISTTPHDVVKIIDGLSSKSFEVAEDIITTKSRIDGKKSITGKENFRILVIFWFL